jgi:hypothetical protein
LLSCYVDHDSQFNPRSTAIWIRRYSQGGFEAMATLRLKPSLATHR